MARKLWSWRVFLPPDAWPLKPEKFFGNLVSNFLEATGSYSARKLRAEAIAVRPRSRIAVGLVLEHLFVDGVKLARRAELGSQGFKKNTVSETFETLRSKQLGFSAV